MPGLVIDKASDERKSNLSTFNYIFSGFFSDLFFWPFDFRLGILHFYQARAAAPRCVDKRIEQKEPEIRFGFGYGSRRGELSQSCDRRFCHLNI